MLLYFLLLPRTILVLSAVIPAIFLLIKVYKADKLEKENPIFILLLIVSGIFSTVIAMVLEELGTYVLSLYYAPESLAYNILMYYVVVAVSEEGSKYFLLRKRTYNSFEFNCQYDAVVYAVAVSLGFALWENILYVFRFGLSVALTRAVTAIPGHCSFGVFMGVWYGKEKRHDLEGDRGLAVVSRVLSLLCPILLHGTYDFLCSINTEESALYFLAFIVVLFLLSFFMVRKKSEEDTYL